MIHGDAVRLQQILWNLVRNASKFSAPGSSIDIRSWNDEAGHVRVAVEDRGIGIEPDILPVIFNPFEQGGEEVTRKFGGLGLGLVISKSLVELHDDGQIEVYSAGKDQGTTFTLCFKPLVEAPVSLEKDPDQPPAKARVMVVEDSRDARKAVTLWLESLNYQVIEADCVQTALNLAETTVFDIVISDIGLPDGSGYDLMSGLRDRDKSAVVGIAMSGYGQHDDLEKSKAAGFVEHLIKPVAPKALENALATALERTSAVR
jgi:CheY-like chemotaxis protein